MIIIPANQQSRQQFTPPPDPIDPDPDPVPTPGAIAAKLYRLRGSSGTALVSCGFWLRPGDLRSTQLGLVQVFVGGVEQAIYVEALQGRHADGSLRSILIQFSHAVTVGAPQTGELRIGTARSTVDIAKTQISAIAAFTFNTNFIGGNPSFGYIGLTDTQKNDPQGNGYADAVFLPTSTDYLLACKMVDPSIPAATASALGGPYANLETQLEFYSNFYWTAWGTFTLTRYPMSGSPNIVDNILLHNQYDRGYQEYQAFARTADVEHYRRACAISFQWQGVYGRLGGQQGQINEHFQTPEGARVHYYSSGDPLSFNYVVAAATRRYELWMQIASAKIGERGGQDPRICGTVLKLCRCAWELGDNSQDWTGRLTNLFDRIFGINLQTGALPARRDNTVIPVTYNGAWIIGANNPGGCSISTNFMSCFMSLELIRYYERFTADARAITIVKNFMDFLNTQYRDPVSTVYMVDGITINPAPSFANEPTRNYSYLSGNTCPSEGGAGLAVDLNSFYATPLAWLYKQGQGAAYLTRAEIMFESLSRTPHDSVNGPLLGDDPQSYNFGKQFNEWRIGYASFYTYRQV
jgi:hypothetical protein